MTQNRSTVTVENANSNSCVIYQITLSVTVSDIWRSFQLMVYFEVCTHVLTQQRIHTNYSRPNRPIYCTYRTRILLWCSMVWMKIRKYANLQLTWTYEVCTYIFYSARNARIASAVLATAIPSVRLSVRPTVCPTHAGIVSKRRHVARCSLHRWIAKCI